MISITCETRDKTSSKIEKENWIVLVHCVAKAAKWMKKSCLVEFNWIIIENILQKLPHKEHYQQLILLYYL